MEVGNSEEATDEEVVTKVEAATKEEDEDEDGTLVVVEGATPGVDVTLMIEAIVGLVVVDVTRMFLALVVDVTRTILALVDVVTRMILLVSNLDRE